MFSGIQKYRPNAQRSPSICQVADNINFLINRKGHQAFTECFLFVFLKKKKVSGVISTIKSRWHSSHRMGTVYMSPGINFTAVA